ncbi:PP2C family protein-serine/threonine phosphatase [Streptomyces sediminimaris]|uniref:PP2C family protein-serine/threonine phosphatase n=1 Tax=Streptomyces sediminimaris TaxID=3383721 RepID=UPI0039997D4D
MRDGGGDPARGTLLRRPAALVLALSLLPVALLVPDLLTPPRVRFGPMMVAAPALAAIFCTPAGVLLVVGATLPCMVAASVANQQFDTANFPVQLTTTVLLSFAAVAASAVRLGKERALARSRRVAAVAQRVLLQPLPRRVGAFEMASLYLAADEEAAIGGDLYAAARQDGSARILLGDVQGKGLASWEIVNCVVNTFRQSVRRGTPLTELVPELETAFREEIGQLSATADPDARAAGPYEDESFVTAVVLDLPEDGPVRLVNLGHPPPLLLHEGKVTALEARTPVPPLGLGDLNGGAVFVDRADFPPGATLLLYTDGVSEARDTSGDFYPLADRVRRWTGLPPEDLLAALHQDLRQYAGSRLTDDVAMVAVRRTPVGVTVRTAEGELTDAHGAA